jgi:hypothetical protein
MGFRTSLFQDFTNGFVSRDRIPDDAIVKKIFHDKAFQTFIAACLGLDKIHAYADPIAGFVLNIMPDGSVLPWHFDTNEFIVSLMIRGEHHTVLFGCPAGPSGPWLKRWSCSDITAPRGRLCDYTRQRRSRPALWRYRRRESAARGCVRSRIAPALLRVGIGAERPDRPRELAVAVGARVARIGALYGGIEHRGGDRREGAEKVVGRLHD